MPVALGGVIQQLGVMMTVQDSKRIQNPFLVSVRFEF